MKIQPPIRLGVIGAGNIATHHIKAATENGFFLDSICARDYSNNAKIIGSQFGFRKVCDVFSDFLEQTVDAYMILTSTDVQVSIAEKLLDKGKPIFIEKPVSSSSQEIRSLKELDKNNQIVVGYNRRNYSSTQQLNRVIKELEIKTFHVNVPELASNPSPSSEEVKYMVLENSVHIFDLTFFLFGQPISWSIDTTDVGGKFFARSIQMKFCDSSTGTMFLAAGVPDNWSITVYAPGNRYVLSPLENFIHFDGMKSIKATLDRPNKRYIPTSSHEWLPDPHDVTFKAGFCKQMQDFHDFVIYGHRPKALASLSEAEFVISFAEEVLA